MVLILHRRGDVLGRSGCAVIVLALVVCSMTLATAFAADVGRASPLSRSARIASPNQGIPESLKSVYPSTFKLRGGAKPPSRRFMAPLVEFDGASLWQYNNMISRVNILGFVISLLTASQLHLDLLGTGAFAAAALPLLLSKDKWVPQRVKVSSAAVTAWGVKLALFLCYRVAQKGHDTRLDDMLSTFGGTATFWLVSAVWGIVCSLPHSLGTTSSAPGNKFSLYVGTAMYVAGLVTETLADLQKWNFKSANPGKFCDVGLWSISQHPNFFGNLLLWAGIFVMNAPALVEPVPANASLWKRIMSYRRLVFALLSPWFMWTLFSGQADGSISNTADLAASKYGKDPKYQEYINSVPLIIPDLFKQIRF